MKWLDNEHTENSDSVYSDLWMTSRGLRIQVTPCKKYVNAGESKTKSSYLGLY